MMISIVVPFFNSEKTLKRLLDSLVQQSYSHWELFLIDDGSTDDGYKICQLYAQQDARINLYRQDNKGTSGARNQGIELCSGELLTFIDSDDDVSKTYLSDLFNDYQVNANPDLVCHGFIIKNVNNNEVIWKIEQSTLITKENNQGLLNTNIFNGLLSSCSKLFKTAIIKKNKLKFDESLVFGEDTIFTLTYCYFSENIFVGIYNNYFYIRRNDSSSFSKTPFESLYNSFNRMLNITNLVMLKFSISTYAIFSFIPSFYGWLFWHIFKSIYKNGYTRKERMLRLDQLNELFYIILKSYLRTQGIKGKIFSILINKKIMMLSDTAILIFSKIKN